MTVYNGSALPSQLPRPWGMYAYTRASIGPSTHTYTHSTQLHESLGLGVVERHKAELYAPSIQSLTVECCGGGEPTKSHLHNFRWR